MFERFFKSKRRPPAPTEAVDDLYAAAGDAHRSKDFSRAVALYERVIALRPELAEAHYRCGNALKDLGHHEAALARYDVAVSHRPGHAHAWCNRGFVLQSLGRQDAALASYDRAIALDAKDPIAHTNRGSLLQARAQWEPALASYDRALASEPGLPQVWFQRGNVLKELGRLPAASASYIEALKRHPGHVEAHYNLGVLLERSGQPRAALDSYDRALGINPGLFQAHYNRAGVLKRLKELTASLAAYDRTLALVPEYVEALSNKGVVLQDLGRWPEAMACYDQAIALRPDYADGHFNRGNLSAAQRHWDLALASYDDAIALRPDHAAACCERGRVLLEFGRVAEALASFRRAVEIDPDFAEGQYNLSLALLQSGDFAAGWRLYEWRWQNAERLSLVEERDRAGPVWLGTEPVAGKTLLLHCEQGLGDTLQFCRFAKSVADLGATVILEVQPPLATLLSGLEGVSTTVVSGGRLPDFDYRCPLMSLPLALGTTLATIPAARAYVRGDPTQHGAWRSRLAERRQPLIGIAWSGNPKHGNDHNRSVRLADWIGSLPPRFDYVCLQKDIRAADSGTLAANPQISSFAADLHDFSDTAALCGCLDLVITVDTSIAHLSGALGLPTWVLVPYNADWRWLLDRTDSPWYPTMRVYRQERTGDWQAVYARIAADLTTLPAGAR